MGALLLLPWVLLAGSAFASCHPGNASVNEASSPRGDSAEQTSPLDTVKQSPADSEAPERELSPAGRPEVLIIGDSMMQFGIGPALKSMLEKKGYRVVY